MKKTFMKWSGNKSKYIKHIKPLLPLTYNTYIEPFIGSGALFLHLEPKKWVINDINKDLINIWNTIRVSPDKIIKYFKKFAIKFIGLSNEEKIVFCRKEIQLLDKMDYNSNRASLFLLMKYSSYMGHILIKNKFNFQGLDLKLYKTGEIYFLSDKYYKNLLNISNYLNISNGTIYNEDYKKILKMAKKDDFIFLDPPYIENEDYEFNYNKDEKLDNNFIDDLYNEVKKLDIKGVKWMMTQADTDIIKNKFNEYKISLFRVYRIQARTYKNELIIKNY